MPVFFFRSSDCLSHAPLPLIALSLCLLPQMAYPVLSVCCAVLAVVVVVYAQRHSQQGK